MQRLTIFAALLAASTLGFTGSALANTIRIDDDDAQCNADFDTIQEGVEAAEPGDTVLVCRGTYREQVTIETDNVKLVSQERLRATIKPPNSTLDEPRALVHIDDADGVEVRNFRLVGPGPGTTDSLRFGVLVENGSDGRSALISGNFIKDIRDSQAAANENGEGIRVGTFDSGSNTSTAGRARIVSNTIVDYQRGGIVVNEDGSFGEITRNVIEGLGIVTGGVPPGSNGIQVAFGGQATATGNRVANNHFFDTSQNSNIGILVFSTDALSRFENNRVLDNDYGILLFDSQNARVRENRVFGNHNEDDGDQEGSEGGIGVFESGSGTGGDNRLQDNDARSNGGLDCDDDTTGTGTQGTGNTWSGNRGLDDDPPGICPDPDVNNANRRSSDDGSSEDAPNVSAIR